jgi:hypothetical protein
MYSYYWWYASPIVSINSIGIYPLIHCRLCSAMFYGLVAKSTGGRQHVIIEQVRPNFLCTCAVKQGSTPKVSLAVLQRDTGNLASLV